MTGRNYQNSTIVLIMNFEGFEAKAYKDGNAYSIGYGVQTYENGSPVKSGDTITAQRATELLIYHVKRFAGFVNQFIDVPLTQNQFDALVSFTYNVGAGNLQKSTLRKVVNADPNNFDAIEVEFLKWVYSLGVKLDALVKRRAKEFGLYKKKVSVVA